MFPLITTTILISLVSVMAEGATIRTMSKRVDDVDSLFNKEGSPALSDFGSLEVRANPINGILYALKTFESNGWMDQHIHPAQIDGHSAAYFDIYGADGTYKTYPIWVQGDNPWWTSGYTYALSSALYGKDHVEGYTADESVKDILACFTGKKTEGWQKKDLSQDKLMDILKKYKESPTIVDLGDKGGVHWYYAVTSVNEDTKMVELWMDVDRKTAGKKKEMSLEKVFDNLASIGRLKDGETMTGDSSSNEDWKNHIASTPLEKIRAVRWK